MALSFSSCALFTVVKNEPAAGPYIFQTDVSIEDKSLSKETRSKLEAGLTDQIDDSVSARKLDKVFWEVLKNPQSMDTSMISRSMEFMHYYLNGEGYFKDSIHFTTDFKGEQQRRAYITYHVWPGPVTRIDSLSYSFEKEALQALADSNRGDAIIKKGDPFAQGPISGELDRLVEMYRNNGYLLFSRNNLYGLWDTLDFNFLQPVLDPMEQARQLNALRNRQLNPTADLDIRLRDATDTTTLKKYYVGHVTLYPDARQSGSTRNATETTIDNLTILQRSNKYRPKIFPHYVYLKRGDLYKQGRYLRTMNRFNNLGTWRLVDIAQLPRENQDTVDFEIRLTPAPKYNFTTNLEGSFSQSVISGNFIGLGINFGLQNRNFLRSANQFSSNLRYGVELGGLRSEQLIQTQQVSLSNSVIFPRYVFPGMKNFKENFRGNAQSVLSFNVANTERRFLFNLTSFNTSWGYEFTWRTDPEKYQLNHKTYNLGIKLPNIEYSLLKRRDSLNRLIDQNPSIRNLFSDGLISSMIANFSMPWNSANNRTLNVLRLNLEESGLLTGMIRNDFIDDQLYRFIKLDAEFAKLFKLSEKSALVLRAFGGIGYELESTANPEKRSQLPFFKQYYSGGPNSMRAWQLRRLGPGSTVKNFLGAGGYPDRFGDVQLEGNIEYRLPLFSVAGVPVNGALFTDVGNIWFLKAHAGADSETFNLSRLGTDLAIGSGAGIRVDFNFFVIRLDYAYKVKDPSPDLKDAAYQNKFFAYPFFKGSQLQVGIGYPFIF
ncbi:BamA/TamA family outer membrane protein [Niabella terrae]